jgi:hypothetical protein
MYRNSLLPLFIQLLVPSFLFALDFFVFLFFFIAVSVRRVPSGFSPVELLVIGGPVDNANPSRVTKRVVRLLQALCLCLCLCLCVCVFYSFFFFPSGLSLVVMFYLFFDIEIFLAKL